ncbi:DUF6985 domain-containing protein [Gordonia hydrophobica]|uniref:DUF6985 domain-containing protein n=1 Tax=Gordonia hydrophobica TaxID=40516 RepID=A0ABZ2TXL4_9ACTN|nr:hypothetical protein [Gordonia hydrophobica]MBM7366368.1 hypothetical protein [Gordonia hydrophobica]
MRSHLDGIGDLRFDDTTGRYFTSRLHVEAFGGDCEFSLDEFEDEQEADVVRRIRNFCAIDRSVLTDATDALFAYYRDVAHALDFDEEVVPVLTRDQVWSNVVFNRRPHVEFEDGHWYVTSEEECSWEEEHGLQLVFTDGVALTRVGAYDGHLTHRSAWGKGYEIPDGAVYWSPTSEK